MTDNAQSDGPSEGHGHSLTRRTAFGVIWMVGWRVTTRLAGMISTLVLARLLLPADFGLLAMATTFSATVEALSQVGTDNALVRQGSPTPAFLNTAFSIQIARGIITGLIVAAAAPFAADLFGEPRLQLVILVLATVPVLAGLDNVGAVEFRRSMDYRKQFYLLAVPRLIQIVLSITAAFMLRSYWALIVGIVAGRGLRLIMTYVLHPFRPRLSFSAWRELTSFSAWSWCASLVRVVWDRADTFVLGTKLGSTTLGFYTIGVEIAVLPVSEMIDPIMGVLMASFSEVRRKGEDVVALVPRIAAAMLIIVFPVALTISAASADVVSILLGPKWEAAASLISIFAAWCIPLSVSYVIYTTLIVTGHVRQDVEVMAIATIVKLGGLWYAVSLGDPRFVALSVLVAACVELALFLVQLHRVGRPRFRRYTGTYLRIAAAASFACAILLWTGLGWHPQFLPLTQAIPQGALIFGLVALTFWGAQFAMWYLGGAADGPEQLILTTARHFFVKRGIKLPQGGS